MYLYLGVGVDTSSDAAYKRFQNMAPKHEIASELSARYMSISDSFVTELSRLEDNLPPPPILDDKGWTTAQNASLEQALVKHSDKNDPARWAKISTVVGRPADVSCVHVT